jgi:hypothetical protein
MILVIMIVSIIESNGAGDETDEKISEQHVGFFIAELPILLLAK